MSALKLSRWPVPFKFLWAFIFLAPFAHGKILSPSERAGFIQEVRAEIDRGFSKLFPYGFETIDKQTGFSGYSSDGKRKQTIKDHLGGEHAFFVRIFEERRTLEERKLVVETTKAMGALWGYPKRFWHDEQYRVFLTEFLRTSHVRAEYFKDDGHLKHFVSRLKKSHQLLRVSSLPFPKKSLHARTKEQMEWLLKVAPEMKVRLKKGEQLLEEVEPSYDFVVHGDLQASNILVGEDVHLIDWSMVSFGDAFEDLGSLAEQLQFTSDQEERVLQAYFGCVRGEDLEKLRQYRLVNRLHFGCFFLRRGLKQMKWEKEALPEGKLGLAQNAYVQEGMGLLAPFLG